MSDPFAFPKGLSQRLDDQREASVDGSMGAPRAPSFLVRALGSFYIARGAWGPWALGGFFSLALVAGLASVIESYRFASLERATATALERQSAVIQAQSIASARIKAWPVGPGQDVLVAQARQALASDASPRAWPPLHPLDRPRDTWFQASDAQAALTAFEARSQAAEDAVARFTALRAQADRQTALVARAQAVLALAPPRGWPEATAAWTRARARVAPALAAADATTVTATLSRIETLTAAPGLRQRLLTAVQGLPASERVALAPALAQAERGLLEGQRKPWSDAQASIQGRVADLAQAYTLKVVNEPGVKSGVWRYPNDNPGPCSADERRCNHYVVVDALEASGRPVTVTVLNEETGRRESASRFAVRVPIETYERVKADKTDNGLIDEPLIGVKKSGRPDVEYVVPVSGGTITKW